MGLGEMARERNAKYYSDRLRRDFPTIFTEMKAGKYKSTRAAAIAAGLVSPPTPFTVLKREWKKADRTEKRKFASWLKSELKASPAPIADAAGHLRQRVALFISRWLILNDSKPGRIMKEMGFSLYNTRLAAALSRGEPLTPDQISKLDSWLVKQGFS